MSWDLTRTPERLSPGPPPRELSSHVGAGPCARAGPQAPAWPRGSRVSRVPGRPRSPSLCSRLVGLWASGVFPPADRVVRSPEISLPRNSCWSRALHGDGARVPLLGTLGHRGTLSPGGDRHPVGTAALLGSHCQLYVSVKQITFPYSNDFFFFLTLCKPRGPLLPRDNHILAVPGSGPGKSQGCDYVLITPEPAPRRVALLFALRVCGGPLATSVVDILPRDDDGRSR